ncbi:MAG: enoyl-CoA hydratase/isomerase family protein [Candidatus Dormibacteria bacterium]
MESPTITVEDFGGLRVITFYRPKKLNAISEEVARGLLEGLHLPSGIRALVLTGAGGNFSAGWDLNEAKNDGTVAVREADIWLEGVNRLARLPVPTIAAVEGYCLGQGLVYAVCCDLRVAGEGARMGYPEIRRGFYPGVSATQRTLRIVGPARAKELLFFGAHLDTATAERWGLIHRVTPGGGALTEARRLGEELAQGPTLALSLIKRLVDEGGDLPLDEGIVMETQLSAELHGGPDVAEGVAAFLERRPPRFVGR